MENGNKKNSGLMAVVVVVAVLIILGVVTFAIIPFLTVRKMVDDSMNMADGNYDTVITAVITENTVRYDEDGTAFYTPVYEYEYNGKTYRVPAGVSSSDKKYSDGDRVELKVSGKMSRILHILLLISRMSTMTQTTITEADKHHKY